MSDLPVTKSTSSEDEPIVHVESDFKPLVQKFMTNRRKEVVAMREALARNDFETTGRIAHGMKGAGGIYGFERIAVLAGTIEQAAKTGSAGPIDTDLELLATYLERVQVMFA